MKTAQAIKETLLVWTVIFSLFAMLTVISVNFDRIMNSSSSFFRKEVKSTQSYHSGSRDERLSQPGYSVILEQ